MTRSPPSRSTPHPCGELPCLRGASGGATSLFLDTPPPLFFNIQNMQLNRARPISPTPTRHPRRRPASGGRFSSSHLRLCSVSPPCPLRVWSDSRRPRDGPPTAVAEAKSLVDSRLWAPRAVGGPFLGLSGPCGGYGWRVGRGGVAGAEWEVKIDDYIVRDVFYFNISTVGV